MCGIVGILYRQGVGPIGRDLIRMLDGCQHRGPHSTRVALFGEGRDGTLVMGPCGVIGLAQGQAGAEQVHVLRILPAGCPWITPSKDWDKDRIVSFFPMTRVDEATGMVRDFDQQSLALYKGGKSRDHALRSERQNRARGGLTGFRRFGLNQVLCSANIARLPSHFA